MLRIRHSLRYVRISSGQIRSFSHHSPVLGSHLQQNQLQHLKSQIENLFEKVPDNRDKDAPIIFRELITKVPEANTSLISAKILLLINASTKNIELLKLALQNVKSEDLDQDALDNMIIIVNKFSKLKSIPTEVQQLFSQIFIERCNDEIIQKFSLGLQEYNGSFNKHVYITLLLKTKKYDEAFDLVKTTLESHGPLRSTSIELLLQHLCHLGEIQKAAEILKLAKEEKHTIYPRTYSVFLSKAVEMNEYEVVSKFQKYILERLYVDNGTLVRLTESLVHAGDFYQIKGLKKLAQTKSSFPEDFMKRIDRSIVESAATFMTFENAFKQLEEVHRGDELEVIDYPYLLGKLEFKGFDNMHEFVHKKMGLTDKNLKKFVLNLVVTKLCNEGDVDSALLLIKKSDLLAQYVTENTILQLSHGAEITKNEEAPREICDLVESLDLKFSKAKTINQLLSVLVNTDHWFYSFKMLQRCDIDGYTMRPTTYSKLAAKCENFESEQHLQYKPEPTPV